MENPEDILKSFRIISLEEMDQVELMNRKDSKFFFNRIKLSAVLELLEKDYRVLEINGKQVFTYHNIYFDTIGFDCYHMHHNQRANRNKIRIRHYVESDLVFLEVKFKTNQDRTIKSRIRIPEFTEVLSGEAKEFLRLHTPYDPDLLVPTLRNDFKRYTLVNNNLKERCTIDTDLILQAPGGKKTFVNLAIAELKQDLLVSGSEFKVAMRLNRIIEGTISKYSVGIAYMYDHLKHNNFKPKKISINRIEHAK